MDLPVINQGEEILSNIEKALYKEWIITNGLGGYSSSTILGMNTRKYHGLLVVAFHPPRDRWVCLSKLDEEIITDTNTYMLGVNEFQNRMFPSGYRFQKKFSLSPFPTYCYSIENVKIEKTIFMPYGKNCVVVIYKFLNKNDDRVKMRILPYVNFRFFHSITDRRAISWEFIETNGGEKGWVKLEVPQASIMMASTIGRYFKKKKWMEGIYFREESLRGESYLDDYYQPGSFNVFLKGNSKGKFALIIGVKKCEDKIEKFLNEPVTFSKVEGLYKKEVERYEKKISHFFHVHPTIPISNWLKWLILATNHFIVKGKKNGQKSVIAGYHWFEVWGRDTFISLPGLTLITGRFKDARLVFLTFKNQCKNGLIPNLISDDAKKAKYNSVDATLWYIDAVSQYLKYTRDFKFVHEHLWETLKTIIENYIHGTKFKIKLDDDGLLSHNSQLTWMDAISQGKPVTPREGKAVEVQALWYNTLKIINSLAIRFKEREKAEKYATIAEKTKKSFIEKFWNAEQECLFDVVNENIKDDSLRPNQIIAVALDFTMLDPLKNEKIVDVVQQEFLTPYGLRTLTRKDQRYIGVYTGDRRKRDIAYHNGTVWSWLLGPFIRAFLKTKGYKENIREYAFDTFLSQLFTKQIYEYGLGNLNEIYDGKEPHFPKGCITQAWSVAEPLRVYIEDIMKVRPRYEKWMFNAS
jgi:predicted glycogen debranching enzyme